MPRQIIQYVLPECTQIVFGNLSEIEDFNFKLISGAATVDVGEKLLDLVLGRERSLTNCKSLLLQSTTGCEVTVQGSHNYVCRATTKTEDLCQNLFGYYTGSTSFAFVFDKGIRLQVFPTEYASKFDTTIESISGKPEVFGFPILRGRSYPLPPRTSFVVNSADDKSCTVLIRGCWQRIKVSLVEDRTLFFMRFVHARLHRLRLKAKQSETVGPTILVIGAKNVGKTSFCTYLLNKAIDNKMAPEYIDLDMCRNYRTVPGAITMTLMANRSVISFKFMDYPRDVLQFGYLHVGNNNFPLYSSLIGKMGELLNQRNGWTRYAGAIINIDGSLGQNSPAIKQILKSFTIDLVAFIGDKNNYDMLKRTVLKNVESEFIPKPPRVEPQTRSWANDVRISKIYSYFYGITSAVSPDPFKANIADIKIYKIVTKTTDNGVTGESSHEFSVETVTCDPSIEYYILGVSEATSIEQPLSLTEIQYFVSFTKVNLTTEIVTVVAPRKYPLSGKILLKTDIKWE